MFSMIVYNWWTVCSSREEPRTGEGIRYPLGSHQQRPNFQKSLFYKMFLGCENLTCVSSKKFSVHSKDTLAACAVKVEASLRCSWFRTNILSKKPTIKIFSSTRIYSLTTLPDIHWKGAPFLGDSTLFNLHSRLSVAWMVCSIGILARQKTIVKLAENSERIWCEFFSLYITVIRALSVVLL